MQAAIVLIVHRAVGDRTLGVVAAADMDAVAVDAVAGDLVAVATVAETVAAAATTKRSI
jgi:hypothetical protein